MWRVPISAAKERTISCGARWVPPPTPPPSALLPHGPFCWLTQRLRTTVLLTGRGKAMRPPTSSPSAAARPDVKRVASATPHQVSYISPLHQSPAPVSPNNGPPQRRAADPVGMRVVGGRGLGGGGGDSDHRSFDMLAGFQALQVLLNEMSWDFSVTPTRPSPLPPTHSPSPIQTKIATTGGNGRGNVWNKILSVGTLITCNLLSDALQLTPWLTLRLQKPFAVKSVRPLAWSPQKWRNKSEEEKEREREGAIK